MLKRHHLIAACAGVLLALSPSAGQAQAEEVDQPERPWATPGLGVGSHGEMSALLEVTIFNIDVLVLTVRVDSVTGQRLESLVEGRSYSSELADSVASVILDAPRLAARQRFVRNVGFGRLLGGMRESSERAADAGFVSREYHERFSAGLPELFAALEERGTLEGDEIYFEVRGDTVSTTYLAVDGAVLVEERGADAEGRAASIPSFYAPDSRFRRRLVESLLERDEGR